MLIFVFFKRIIFLNYLFTFKDKINIVGVILDVDLVPIFY